jgi:hypothetical protein
VIASDEVNAVGRLDVLLAHVLLQQVALLVVNDVSLVGDVSSIQQIIIDLMLGDFLVKVRVLLLVNKLPLIRARIENLNRRWRSCGINVMHV